MRSPIQFAALARPAAVAIALLFATAPFATLPVAADNPQGDDLEALLRSLWLCQEAVAVQDLNYSKALDCEVELEFTADELVVAASGVPHHDHYSGPGGQGTNGVEPQDYEWRLPLAPTNDTDCNPAESTDGCEMAPELGPIAVALNGAPIYGPEDGPGGDAVATHIGQYEETEQNIWLGVCGGHSGPGGTYHYHFDANCVHWHPENEGETHQVTITDDKDFLPEDLTINVGDTVTWTNDDDSSHTVTAEDGQFHSENIAEGATWSYTFTETGMYDYGCDYHGGMEGSVSVVEEDDDIVWTDYDFSQVDDTVHSPIVGFAFDGYPIYGSYGWGDDSSVKLIRSSYLLNDGAMGEEGIQDYHFEADSGDLDACNGRFSATPEFPEGIYHYHSTPPVSDTTNNAFPYFINCYRGIPDLSNTNAGGGEPPGGGPPDNDDDGVSNGWDDCADTPTTVWPDGEPIFPRGCTQAQYDAAGQEPVLDAYSGNNPPAPPDADSDGIVDPQDECSNSPYGKPVYRNGCTTAQNSGGEQPLSLTITDGLPDWLAPFSPSFAKSVDVFGVVVIATANTPDAKLLHATAVMAQYLDNDEDGVPDNPAVVQSMVAAGAVLLMVADEDDAEPVFESLPEAAHQLFNSGVIVGQELWGSETAPLGSFDASLEEVLHLITDAGYARAYPEAFGTGTGTELTEAMDAARGGHFTEDSEAECEDDEPNSDWEEGQCALPPNGEYSEAAWYHYGDPTCSYGCMATEYIYWALTTLLDAQSDPQRCDLISNEWEPCTPAMLEQNDQTIYALLTDPAYGFPTVLPNGNYASTSGGGEEPPPLVEICLDDHSGLSQHFHVALEIYDNGAPLTIPADIGIDTEACPGGMHIIHTHDGSGRLHIETPEPGPILLGTFFSIWGQSFSAQQVLHMVADGNSTLTLEVNDVLVDTWGETQLADEQLIVVEYQLAGGGETDDPPDDTDDSPANDTGNPPANNTSKQSDDTDGISGLPASSLLASAAVVSIIALRCRRSD